MLRRAVRVCPKVEAGTGSPHTEVPVLPDQRPADVGDTGVAHARLEYSALHQDAGAGHAYLIQSRLMPVRRHPVYLVNQPGVAPVVRPEELADDVPVRFQQPHQGLRLQDQVRVHAEPVVIAAVQHLPDRPVPQLAHHHHVVVGPDVVVVRLPIFQSGVADLIAAADIGDDLRAVVHHEEPIDLDALRDHQLVQGVLVGVEDPHALPHRRRDQYLHSFFSSPLGVPLLSTL